MLIHLETPRLENRPRKHNVSVGNCGSTHGYNLWSNNLMDTQPNEHPQKWFQRHPPTLPVLQVKRKVGRSIEGQAVDKYMLYIYISTRVYLRL